MHVGNLSMESRRKRTEQILKTHGTSEARISALNRIANQDIIRSKIRRAAIGKAAT